MPIGYDSFRKGPTKNFSFHIIYAIRQFEFHRPRSVKFP